MFSSARRAVRRAWHGAGGSVAEGHGTGMDWSRLGRIGVWTAVGALLTLLSAWLAWYVHQRFLSEDEEAFNDRLLAVMQQGPGVLPLAEIIALDWDTVCLVQPYTDLDTYPEPRVRRSDFMPWIGYDTYRTLVILNDTAPPRPIRLDNSHIRLPANHNECFARRSSPVVLLLRSFEEQGRNVIEIGITTQLN